MTDNKDALSALELIRKALIKADKEQGLSHAELEAFEEVFEYLTTSPSTGFDVSREREPMSGELIDALRAYSAGETEDGEYNGNLDELQPHLKALVEAARSSNILPDAQGWLPEDVTPEKFIQGCGHILSIQSAELMQKYIRHYYPNGLRIIPPPPQPAKDKSNAETDGGKL